MKITKAIWDSWKKEEKRREKDGTCKILSKNTGEWVTVFWKN